ncbi:hypothetical protein Tco_1158311 [Tanacetum coccineum]
MMRSLQRFDADDLEEMDLKWQPGLTKQRWNAITIIKRALCKGMQGSKGEQEQRTCKEECEVEKQRKSFGVLLKMDLGYNGVAQSENDLSYFAYGYTFSESITSVPAVETSKVKTSELKPKSVGEPLIEDWISDSEDENETEFKSKQRKPSFAKVEFVKSYEHVKIPRESVDKVSTIKNSNLNEKVNTVKGYVTTVGPKAVVSDNKGNEANVVKASTCCV